jgi:hypothetical protein
LVIVTTPFATAHVSGRITAVAEVADSVAEPHASPFTSKVNVPVPAGTVTVTGVEPASEDSVSVPPAAGTVSIDVSAPPGVVNEIVAPGVAQVAGSEIVVVDV